MLFAFREFVYTKGKVRVLASAITSELAGKKNPERLRWRYQVVISIAGKVMEGMEDKGKRVRVSN